MKINLLLFFIIPFCFAFSIKTTAKPSIQSADGLYKFTGKLNDKIPVFLWFVVKDSVLEGEVTYLKTAKRAAITIIGQLRPGNGVHIFEFSGKGNVTGIYDGTLSQKSFSGTWASPVSGKQLSCKLMPKDTVLAPTDLSLKPVSAEGEYDYHFGKGGGDGGIGLKSTGGGNYLIDINCVTAAPAYNLADMETFKGKMINYAITFKVPDTQCVLKYKRLIISW